MFSHSGAQDLFVPKGHSPGASLTHMTREGESFTTISVPVVALDDYFGENDRVTLLKIDVEGGEFGVLKGAERILRRCAPLLVFECENRHLAPGTVGDVFSYLETLGYRGSFVCARPGAAALGVRRRGPSAPGRRVVLEEQGLLQQFCLRQTAGCGERSLDGFLSSAQPPASGAASVVGKGTPGRYSETGRIS